MAREQWILLWKNEGDGGTVHENVSPYQELAIQKREEMLSPHTFKRKGRIVKEWPTITWTAIIREKVR